MRRNGARSCEIIFLSLSGSSSPVVSESSKKAPSSHPESRPLRKRLNSIHQYMVQGPRAKDREGSRMMMMMMMNLL